MARDKYKETINFSIRIKLSLLFILFSFGGILARLWYLQTVQGDHFKDLSENNRLQSVFLPPPRGIIEDRDGNIIVSNRPGFNIELTPEDTPDEKLTVTTLANILHIPPDVLFIQLQLQKKRRKFEPKLLLKDVSREVVAKVSANKYKLPGISVNAFPARDYIYGDFASHAVGYIREITQKQLEEPNYALYMRGDLVGQVGIESLWENYLQGQRGIQWVIVNANGTRVGELPDKKTSEIIGNTVQLSLNSPAQKAADLALATQPGAVIAMSPRTGEILALSSSLRYDPNHFTTGISVNDWNNLASGKRLQNKVIQGGYPPGSVHKVFVAAAALAEGLVKPTDKVRCPGYYNFAGRSYKCHKKEGHGVVDLRSALVQSCDVYFYTIGLKLGVDKIHKWLSKFGFGKITGLGFPEESQGILPSSEWKRRYHKNPGDKKWYAGETLSVAIGQGANKVTPLQSAVALSALVNGGHVYKPKLVRYVKSNDGRIIEDLSQSEEIDKIDIDPKILDLVRQNMVAVVNDPRGTGKRAQLDPALGVLVGGKTGTAQVASLKRAKADKGNELKDHAWFAGFAPAENPEIVVVAFIENGGGGGAVAAPVVKQVMEAYFRAKTPSV